ncbi:MAG: hypothetical protein DWQ36_08005 [Acidobacteria bacterium]|nr:MAG: hypothetical protein DWQ30_03820 [Acidobacteriota bacterium]REK08906.1 MAG: hypothetical protein DWQ36_08005 [Acidobacteriota bacterium]
MSVEELRDGPKPVPSGGPVDEQTSPRQKRTAVSLGSITATLLLLVLPITAWVRLVGLDEVGVQFGDSPLYYEIASRWSEGEPVLSWPPSPNRYFVRPVLYAAFAGAIELFGHRDDAIKRLNAAADVLTTLLLFVLVARQAGSLLAAALAALTYGLSPWAISFARSELAHPLSGLLVLLAFTLLLAALEEPAAIRRRILIGCYLFFQGAAVLVHEDLVATMPAGLLLLVAAALARSERRRGELVAVASLLVSFAFVVGRWIPFPLKPRLYAELAEKGASGILETAFWSPLIIVERAARHWWNALTAVGSSMLPLLLLALTLVVILAPRLRQRGKVRILIAGWVLQLCYFCVVACFLRFFIARWTLALLPLVLAMVFVALHRIVEEWPTAVSALLQAFVAGILVVGSVGNHAEVDLRKRQTMEEWLQPRIGWSSLREGYERLVLDTYEQRWSRGVYDVLRDEVGADSNLLVAPSLHDAWPGRRLLSLPCYFGDHVIYLIDQERPLRELIVEEDVTAVLLTRRNLRADVKAARKSLIRTDDGWQARPQRLGASTGLEGEAYTVEREIEAIREVAAGLGGKRSILPTGDELWRLPDLDSVAVSSKQRPADGGAAIVTAGDLAVTWP